MMMATTSGLSSTREKNLYHPKFEVDDIVSAEPMDMEIPFCSEQILVQHQLRNCSSPAVVVEFAFNFLAHRRHLFNNGNNDSFANLQAGCSPPANSFWPLGRPIPSPPFTYEAGGAGIPLQHNSDLLCYEKTLENLVTSSSSSLKKEETKSQVVKQVTRAASLRATTTAGKLDHHHHGLTL